MTQYFAKIISRIKNLIICFLAVSRSNWLKKWNRHLTDFSAPKHPQKVPQKTKKVNNFRRNRRGTKKHKNYFFCSTLVVGCTKTRFTLLYKRKIDLPVFCLTPKCPPKLAGNCLTKKLFNYLFFWFGSKNSFFSTKSSENGLQKWLKFRKNCLTKKKFNYLLFGRFSKQLFEEMESTFEQFFCSETPPNRV